MLSLSNTIWFLFAFIRLGAIAIGRNIEQAERNVSPENQLETKEKRKQPRGTDLPRQQRYRKLSLLRNADFLFVIGDITGISIKLY